MSQDDPGTHGKVYRLAPTPDEHVAASRRMILAAAGKVRPGDAIVLGAGRCAEIPLAGLTARFGHLVLNDFESPLLEEALDKAALPSELRGKIELDARDSTGATAEIVEQIAARLGDPSLEFSQAINAMAAIVDTATLPAVVSPRRFELVVASCLLSQLHVALVQQAAERFGARFPGQEAALRDSTRWTTAIYQYARRVEQRFIDQLVSLASLDGRIFLSESVQMCFIDAVDDGQWQTAGTFRMLRTKDLADYLDARFAIESTDRWHWVYWPDGVGAQGRLYDVQGLVLRRAR